MMADPFGEDLDMFELACKAQPAKIEEGAVYLSRKGDSDSMAQIFQELFK